MNPLVATLKAKLAPLSTVELKKMANDLMTNYDEGAGIVFNFVLEELENRMAENEYVAFCDSLGE